MRGNNVMLGYHDDPEATAHAFRGGWFHSGDLAVWHPDGTIELRDRAKDVIISGGENISTIEVEQALASHPAVLECAVVAIPHERWGERPKAFVTLREGAEATRRGVDRALPRRASRASRRPMPSSSARCRRRRPARSRSSSCAIANGATAWRASTDVVGCRAARDRGAGRGRRDRLSRHRRRGQDDEVPAPGGGARADRRVARGVRSTRTRGSSTVTTAGPPITSRRGRGHRGGALQQYRSDTSSPAMRRGPGSCCISGGCCRCEAALRVRRGWAESCDGSRAAAVARRSRPRSATPATTARRCRHPTRDRQR